MNSSKKSKNLLKLAFGAAILALCILGVLLFRQYQHIQRLSYFAHHQSFFSSLHGAHSLSTGSASSTQTWMTFAYINRVFALPPLYLETALAVTDARYPNMTVSQYAAVTRLAPADALIRVQSAIAAYLPNK